MKTRLYRKWIKLVETKFKGHFMTRYHTDVLSLAVRVWRYGNYTGSYPRDTWITLSEDKNVNYGMEMPPSFSDIWKKFKHKYRKYSRKYWTAYAIISRDILGIDD